MEAKYQIRVHKDEIRVDHFENDEFYVYKSHSFPFDMIVG